MRILSDDAKLLEKIYNDFQNKNIDVEIVKKESEKGSQLTGIEIAGIIVSSVSFAGGVVSIVDYLEKLEKEGHLVFFRKENVDEVALKKFASLSQTEQKRIMDNYTTTIDKK
jgi:hypothetical protein